MAVRSASITVSVTPVLIAVGNSGGSRVYLHQEGTSNHSLYLGPSGVTVSNGFLIHKGETLDLYLPEGEKLYAVANNTESIYVLQTGGI